MSNLLGNKKAAILELDKLEKKKKKVRIQKKWMPCQQQHPIFISRIMKVRFQLECLSMDLNY